ncbi:Mce family protein (plasmid) [Rhodococcus sp. ZPP]|uniref:Mce family protein n=1 Tax=Rhodococcus sp. ZPP TaxID=2749906 RepID=UPI001AD87620|nr:Mce family protein [Rhodococcus sp. ZPP]QTJ70729.1 Mce family protein [Rhodococcus sp. ZPP]
MTKSRNQDFLRGTDAQQARVVTITALVLIVLVTLSAMVMVWVQPRMEKPDGLALSIDVPFVAPGVGKGTKALLHGAEVGEITDLVSIGNRNVRMNLSLDPERLDGMTDAFDIDFRPANYFGITAVNLIANSGGDTLVAGQVLNRVPAGDFTMSHMLETGSLAIDGTLTKSMITALDEVIRYTDGVTPMIQTGIILADRVAQTQKAMPSELLDRANDILEVLPAFSQQTIEMLNTVYKSDIHKQPDGSFSVDEARFDDMDAAMGLVVNGLFGGAGRLLGSHGVELTPMTQVVQTLTDAVPHMLGGGATAGKLSILVDRYSRAFSSTPEGSKALNLRIILDDLPGLAAPLAMTGLPQIPGQESPR